MQIHALYPSYLGVGYAPLTHAENEDLAEMAWEIHSQNMHKDAAFPAHSKGFYAIRPQNLLENYQRNPVAQKFARFVDQAVRDYLLGAYGYVCHEQIRLLSEVFCPDDSTGTSGMVTHTHNAPINMVYYPRVRIPPVGEAVTGKAGRNGEVDFFNPTGRPKKPWPTLKQAHFHASAFRLKPASGMFTVFEGYLPHSSAQFAASGERVVITTSCSPIFPNSNPGLTMDELLA
jgi:hypothetical protein